MILGVTTGITQREYDLLTQIAPTVAQSGEHIDFGTPWQETTLTIGQALGRDDRAHKLVADVEGQFARRLPQPGPQYRQSHPEPGGQESPDHQVLRCSQALADAMDADAIGERIDDSAANLTWSGHGLMPASEITPVG
ncbi:MAG: ABC transporter substrate-binding protein [Pseudonocardiaceae bacterium]